MDPEPTVLTSPLARRLLAHLGEWGSTSSARAETLAALLGEPEPTVTAVLRALAKAGQVVEHRYRDELWQGPVHWPVTVSHWAIARR